MRAFEIIEWINKGAQHLDKTCDTIKSGHPEQEIKKIAVSMFATVDVIKKAQAWKADMLIVHEPTYYNHMDVLYDDEVTLAKKRLIDQSHMLIYRYHDHMHFRDHDLICEGELHYLNLPGNIEKTVYVGSYIMHLDEPITAVELAKQMEEKLHIKQVKIAGTRHAKVTKIALCFGTPNGVFELLSDASIEMVITGEAIEWKHAEYVRDADALGYHKSLLVMGHIGSERDGMRLVAEKLEHAFKDIKTQYFECKEVYTHTS